MRRRTVRGPFLVSQQFSILNQFICHLSQTPHIASNYLDSHVGKRISTIPSLWESGGIHENSDSGKEGFGTARTFISTEFIESLLAITNNQ